MPPLAAPALRVNASILGVSAKKALSAGRHLTALHDNSLPFMLRLRDTDDYLNLSSEMYTMFHKSCHLYQKIKFANMTV